MAPDDGTPFQRSGGVTSGTGLIETAPAIREQLLDWAEGKVATLQAELVGLVSAERAAVDVAEYAAGEAVDLRRRLDLAEQRADDERERADRAETRADEERHRADRAEQRMGEERARADRAEKRADGAEATVGASRPRLTELRISERVAIDRAKYATGEADDLRKRLDTAEQLTGEERVRADRERDRAERAQARADRAEKRADDERDRANQAEARTGDALLRVQELTQAMAEKAATPEPDPPRTRWRRFMAWRRWPA